MSYKIDQRGSKDQQILYNYLSEMFPSLDVIYEYALYELNQRIDIYIPNLALAFEYHGRQHYDFVEHFHKTLQGFEDAQKMDQRKREYLLLHGIKLIEIPYNKMVTSKEELQKLIDDQPYPDFPYIPLPEESEKQNTFKENMKKQRKEEYKKSKGFYAEDPLVKKERLEKERQFRKERYKKMKENK